MSQVTSESFGTIKRQHDEQRGVACRFGVIFPESEQASPTNRLTATAQGGLVLGAIHLQLPTDVDTRILPTTAHFM